MSDGLIDTLRLLFISLTPEQIGSAVHAAVEPKKLDGVLDKLHDEGMWFPHFGVSVTEFQEHCFEEHREIFIGDFRKLFDEEIKTMPTELIGDGAYDEKRDAYSDIFARMKLAGLTRPFRHQASCPCSRPTISVLVGNNNGTPLYEARAPEVYDCDCIEEAPECVALTPTSEN